MYDLFRSASSTSATIVALTDRASDLSIGICSNASATDIPSIDMETAVGSHRAVDIFGVCIDALAVLHRLDDAIGMLRREHENSLNRSIQLCLLYCHERQLKSDDDMTDATSGAHLSEALRLLSTQLKVMGTLQELLDAQITRVRRNGITESSIIFDRRFFWLGVESALVHLLSDYLDVNGSGTKTIATIDDGQHSTILKPNGDDVTSLSAYFRRQKTNPRKTPTLFRFDAAAHAFVASRAYTGVLYTIYNKAHRVCCTKRWIHANYIR
jgi:hypothetical protein